MTRPAVPPPPPTAAVPRGATRLAEAVAFELEGVAPPKIAGGSPARQQWLADMLAVQAGFHAAGRMIEFVRAIEREELLSDTEASR